MRASPMHLLTISTRIRKQFGLWIPWAEQQQEALFVTPLASSMKTMLQWIPKERQFPRGFIFNQHLFFCV